jgi:hypothetical protein
MCFIFCCCCNWCNKYSSKCIEITILVLLITSLSVSIVALIFVDKEHSSKEGYACLIVVAVLIIILIFSIILIIIWRFKTKINNTRNIAGSTFDIIGLILTIFSILFTGLWENFSITKFYDINNPCKSNENIEINNKSNKRNLVLFLKRNLLTYEGNKEEFCLENPNYNANIISIFEYISVFACSSILEILFLLLLYFWFNDFRRIKFLVDGPLVDSNTKESKIKYKIRKLNNNNNHMIYQNDYVVHYDIYGRPIINIKKNKTKIININNNNKNLQNNIRNVKTIDESKMKNNNIGNINKFDNKENNDEKIIEFKNDNNNKDGINIFNLNFSKNKRKIQISGLNMSKSTSTMNVKDNSTFNNNKLPFS